MAELPGAAVKRLISKHVSEPHRLSLSTDTIVADAVEHHYYVCGQSEKTDYLVVGTDPGSGQFDEGEDRGQTWQTPATLNES